MGTTQEQHGHEPHAALPQGKGLGEPPPTPSLPPAEGLYKAR